MKKSVIAHEGLDKSVVGVFERPHGFTKFSYIKVTIKGDKWYIPYVYVKNSMRPANIALRSATKALAYSARTRDLNIERAISARMSYGSPPPPVVTDEDGTRIVMGKAKA